MSSFIINVFYFKIICFLIREIHSTYFLQNLRTKVISETFDMYFLVPGSWFSWSEYFLSVTEVVWEGEAVVDSNTDKSATNSEAGSRYLINCEYQETIVFFSNFLFLNAFSFCVCLESLMDFPIANLSFFPLHLDVSRTPGEFKGCQVAL